jgi:CRISPR-associated protein Cas1
MKNEFNQFNLACDLMEPFRPFLDDFIFQSIPFDFDLDFKVKIINFFHEDVIYDNTHFHLNTAFSKYVNNTLKVIGDGSIENLKFCEISEE